MLKKLAIALSAVACLGAASSSSLMAFAQTSQETPQPADGQRPPVEAFAAGATIVSAAISPSGRYIAFVRQTGGDGEFDVDELVLLERPALTPTVLARAREAAGVQLDWVDWKTDDRLLVGTANRANLDGEINWVSRVISMPRTGGESVQLFEGSAHRLAVMYAPVSLADRLPRDPAHVLLEAYGPNGNALWRSDVNTGRVEKVLVGRWDTLGWLMDINGYPVMRIDSMPRDSGLRYYRRGPGERDWSMFFELKKADATNQTEFIPFAAADTPGHIYVAARPNNEDRVAIYSFDTATGQYGPSLLAHPSADAEFAIIDSKGLLYGLCADVQRLECIARDRAIGRYLGAADAFFNRSARVEIVGTSDDFNVWLLNVEQPGATPALFVFDRAALKIDPIVSTHEALAGVAIAPISVASYKSRDGTDLWGYLTNGPAAGAAPKALVVMPHGGPDGRDASGFNDWAQFLASRGYAVFQPNFRGGGGFGRAFSEAGYRQWGQRMQDDITDGVRHLIETHQIDPARVCIFGWSYGGYAALAGGALTPDLYRCVISGSGPSDLMRMLETERTESGRGSAGYAYWVKVIGDPAHDRAAIDAVSPRRLAASFRAPVLLLHGDADNIVDVEQSRMMKRALTEAGKQVTLVEYLNEGHSPHFWEPENRVAYLKEIDTFLAANLPPN